MDRIRMFVCCVAAIVAATVGAQECPTLEQVGPKVMPREIAPIKAPFEMPQLQRPVFPEREVTVRMPREGVATKAVQQAIDRLAELGGGTVVIPAGDWTTGRITLRSDINLHLAEGCRLHFSGRIADYQPVVFTRDEGIEIYSLGAFIYANGERNIALTGKGEIVGPSTDCEIYQQNKAYCLNIEKIVGELPLDERHYDGIRTKEVFLPKTVAPINCTNVLIEGVTLTQGLYWNVVPQYCENVIIRGVTVSSFGHGRTDGIDVESSRNVLIEYCSLDCQDDCYTMKSGRGWDGLRINRPTENVVVRHSLALRGAGGIVCGTEVAGFVRNVYCHDCVFLGTDQAFRIKSRRTRGGGVENYFVERVRADVKYQAFYCDLLGEPKWMGELAQRFPKPERTRFTPYFHDVSVHDVIVENCRDFISFTGQPELPVKNVFFGNATVRCKRIGRVQDVTGLALKDVQIHSEDSILTLDGCSVVNIFGLNNTDRKEPVRVVQSGEPSRYVSVQEVPMQPVAYHSVRSGAVWLDTDGKPIQAHGFQMTCIDGTYYWYGENKADALLGTTRMFGGVRCYSSKDFYNWQDEGLILPPDTVDPLSPIHYSQKLERPHIIRNPRTGKYVLWAKSQADDGYFAIFQADRFKGPYTFVRNLQPEGFGVGDFDMYVDEQTGRGYVWFERPHWELICADLTDDFTDVTDTFSCHFVGQRPPYTREAPAHFFANGKHYLFTSGTTGYTSNPSEVAVFDDYHGEYRILGDPHVGDSCASSFNSQITGVFQIPQTGQWVALADRWEPHTTGTDLSRRTLSAYASRYANYQPQARKSKDSVPQVVDRRYKLVDMAHAVYHAGYVLLPITFDSDGMPRIHWRDEWQLETAVPPVQAQKGNCQTGDYGYLFCHMNDRGRAWTAYALSRDGLHYHDLLDGDSIFSDWEHARIEGATRDAYICRKHDGKGYLMVCTDMNVARFKELKKQAEWDNYGICLLRSDDLIHWESTSFDYRQGPDVFCNPEAESVYRDWSTVNRVWAPQMVWDEDYLWPDGKRGGYMVYYSMWNRAEERYDRMYYSYADESFTRLTQPRLLFDWGYATIDADINWVTADQQWHMMIKKEGGTPGLFTATAPALTGPWSEPVEDDYVSFEGNKKCEGVSAFQLAGHDDWTIGYIEYSSRPRNYRLCTADRNMRNFHSPRNIEGVARPQHGSFLRLTKEEYDRLQAWSDTLTSGRTQGRPSLQH